VGQIKYLKKKGFKVAAVSSPGPEVESVERRDGIRVYQMPILRRISPFAEIIVLFRLFKTMRRLRPTVVHAHTPKAGLLGMIAARLALVRCRVYTCHGLPLETESGLRRKLLVWAEQVTCALANRILVVSQSLLNVLREYKICSDTRLTILANGTACGVDLNRF